MKVKEIKRLFEKFPNEADVGFVGHFGEFVPADKYTFHLHGHCSVPVVIHGGDIVEIYSHDFGPSPD